MAPVQTLVRSATPADYPAFARFFAELGTGDSPLSEERWRALAMPTSLLFELDGEAAGYCMFEILSETGYIRHVVVAPEARGLGVGHAIMAELRRRFKAAGCTSMCLNVKPDNLPAIALYERAGMRPAHRATALRMDFSDVERLPKPRARLHAQPLTAAEDALFEQHFALERGLVQRRRELPDMLVLGLREWQGAGTPVGLACFDPHFPGAFPFCAQDAAAARGLFESLQRFAPGLAGCALVVEHDEPLSAALMAAGAQVRLEVVHYRGAV